MWTNGLICNDGDVVLCAQSEFWFRVFVVGLFVYICVNSANGAHSTGYNYMANYLYENSYLVLCFHQIVWIIQIKDVEFKKRLWKKGFILTLYRADIDKKDVVANYLCFYLSWLFNPQFSCWITFSVALLGEKAVIKSIFIPTNQILVLATFF